MRLLPRLFLAAILAFAGAAMSFAANATDANQVIVPGATRAAEGRNESNPGYTALTFVGVLALAGAGVWMLLRGRKLPLGGVSGARSLNVAETKSLGNRQYLVVATYENKKFLLGVCPGRIDLLSELPASDATKEKTP